MASDVVKRTHQVVMGRPDEQFGPAFELLLGLSDSGQDEPIDAAAILMNSVKKLFDRARFDIEVQCPEKPPELTGLGRQQHRIELLSELRRQQNVVGDDQRVRPEDLRRGQL